MNALTSRLGRVMACAALAASAAACATVTRGTNEAWTVKSFPPGAAVKTSNGRFCDMTPCTIKMPRKAEFEVTISKDGYKPYQGHVTHAVATRGGVGFAGNVLIGGVIGAGVDVADGSMMDLKPNPLIVELEKADLTPAVASATPATSAAATPAPALATPSVTGPAVARPTPTTN